MSIWTDAEDDCSWILGEDGETIRINTASGGYELAVFWRAGGMDEGAQAPAGPHIYVASADLPADAQQGNSVIRAHTTYTIAGLQPDGYGMTRVVLRE